MSLSLGYLNQKYIKISENVILVTIAREVDHIKEFLFLVPNGSGVGCSR